MPTQRPRTKQTEGAPVDGAAPADVPAEDIAGTVERIVFRSEETGYTVAAVRIAGRKDEAMVVGNCAALAAGEQLRARGRWTRHRQHGYQFQADRMESLPPVHAAGIEKYLGSGLIRGIGKELAARLVNRFGDDTLRVIEKESRRLEDVPGIGPKRREQIKESWNEQRAVRDVMIFLQGHGTGVAQAHRIFRAYGDDAIRLVRENPYRLCREIWGIGFKSADKIASNLGIPHDSDIRARAGILYVLQTLTEEGDCFCPRPELVEQGEALLAIPPPILERAIDREIERGTLVCEGAAVYPRELHEAEAGIAARVRRILGAAPAFRPIDVGKAVEWAESRMSITFDPGQREALCCALAEKLSIITGGPGVGKTTIVRALVDVFGARRLRIQLAAPTGRAAKRMEEATGHSAQTLHRLLKFNPKHGGFDFGPGNPVPGDVFILDEVSMIDTALMHAFLGAIPDTCWLVLVGDVDQLPSVGPGNVLRDLIDSGRVPARRLETIFRQVSGSWIVRNAHRVNNGLSLEFPESDEPSDFFFIEQDEPDAVVQSMLNLVTRRIPQRFGFNRITEIQVLTPMRRNQLGSENLNAVLQEALNPAGPSLHRFGRTYREGDRVLQVRNNYDKGVFNGDIGIVAALDESNQQLAVDYDGQRVPYDVTELDELDLAYACSIHKSQGSEYPAVVILLATQHFKLLQRNLLYTGITRGKRLVCLVGSRKAVYIAVRNDKIRQRRTGLKDRLAAAGTPAAT